MMTPSKIMSSHLGIADDMEVDLESHVKVKKQSSKMATNKEKGKQKRPPPHPTNLVALRNLVDFYASYQPKAKKVDHVTFSCSVGDKFTKLMGIDNEEVLDFGEIMSQMIKRENGNLESCEEKSELGKYLGDAYESLNDPSLISQCGGKTKKRDTLFLLRLLEMCLPFVFLRSLLSPPLAPMDVYLNFPHFINS
ncbi:hypothetical protein Cgig2_020750 [Carnegiea gigantea]|uniref:Uncharacterized protein n=1 Tax=Carnegiea gigantea TaxID=171969 RepID=A0A9Q1GJN3_9CARY|nr:hypothetical protein Cgig2_020750 [Carnegiea gigantea]